MRSASRYWTPSSDIARSCSTQRVALDRIAAISASNAVTSLSTSVSITRSPGRTQRCRRRTARAQGRNLGRSRAARRFRYGPLRGTPAAAGRRGPRRSGRRGWGREDPTVVPLDPELAVAQVEHVVTRAGPEEDRRLLFAELAVVPTAHDGSPEGREPHHPFVRLRVHRARRERLAPVEPADVDHRLVVLVVGVRGEVGVVRHVRTIVRRVRPRAAARSRARAHAG